MILFATVVSESSQVLSIASMQAYCQSRGDLFLISVADVVGSLLHIPLHSPVPMYLLLYNLPHPLVSRYLFSFQSCYLYVA